MLKHYYKISLIYLIIQLLNHPAIASLLEADFKSLSIPLKQDIMDLPVRSKPLNIQGFAENPHTIDNRIFRLQNVSGQGMRCFFNAIGLIAEDQLKELQTRQDDPIIRYMIANEIISASRTPEQLPKEVKEAILYTLYEAQQAQQDYLERLRSKKLFAQSPDENLQDITKLPSAFQDLKKRTDDIQLELKKRAFSITSFNAFLNHHINKNQMMVVLHDVKGDEGGDENSNLTSIDAIAYINKIALKIYQPTNSGALHLVHQFIPKEATEIAYLYHEGIHFQALIPAVTREEFLKGFLEQSSKATTYIPPTDAKVSIEDNLTESPDKKDYIRLLNIRYLMRNKPNDSTTEQIRWITALSKQIDALSIHEGCLREVITPKGRNPIFWRRLSYLHHGLNIPQTTQDTQEFIVKKIWESNELRDFEDLIEKFFEYSIYEARAKVLNIKSLWIERIVNVLAWPNYVNLWWYCEHPVSLADRIRIFFPHLKFSGKGLDYVTIHPYLSADTHPDTGPVVLGKNLEIVKRRSREKNRDVYDEEKYRILEAEIKSIKKERDRLQNLIRKIQKDQTISESDKEEQKKDIVKELEVCKANLAKKESGFLIPNHDIDQAVMEVVDNLEHFGRLEIEKKFSVFDEFYSSISHLEFSKISFYIGLLNEGEHLSIANQYLTSFLGLITPPNLSTTLHIISLTAEALNNILQEDNEDLEEIKEIMRFLRNKVVEHKTKFVKEKLMKLNALSPDKLTTILKSVTKDLSKVKRKVEEHYNKKIGQLNSQNINSSFTTSSKPMARTNDETPMLAKLREYFSNSQVTLEDLLPQTIISVSNPNKPQGKKDNVSNEPDKEVYSLNELIEYVEQINALVSQFKNRKDLEDNLKDNLLFRLGFYRALNDVKESFCYLSENLDSEYLDRIISVFDEEVLWYLYYDLRDRRNLVTHDLWRTDINGLINTALRIRAILKPAIEGKLRLPELEFPVEREIKKFIEKNSASLNVNSDDYKGFPVLFCATIAEDLSLIERLLNEGANPNIIVNRQGNTLLHYVLENYPAGKQEEILELLLKYGAISDTRNARGETPYKLIMIKYGTLYSNYHRVTQFKDIHIKLFELIKSYQSYQRGNEADSLTSMLRQHHSKKSNRTQLPRLLKEEFSIDLYDEYGETPLCISIRQNSIFPSQENKDLLTELAKTANPDLSNYIGLQESPLHLAVQSGFFDIVQVFSDRHANVSRCNREGTTPLHYAVGFNNLELARFLLSRGADVNLRDYLGLSPIFVASYHISEMFEILLEAGANPNERSDGEITILETIENLLEFENLGIEDVSKILQIRELLLAKEAYPLIRLTFYQYFTIAFQLEGLRKLNPNSADLKKLAEDYNLEVGNLRWEKCLRALNNGNDNFERILDSIKKKKKFIFALGSQAQKNQVKETLVSFTHAGQQNESYLSALIDYEHYVTCPEPLTVMPTTYALVEELGFEEKFMEDVRQTYGFLIQIREKCEKSVSKNSENLKKLLKYLSV